LIIEKISSPKIIESEDLDKTERGSSGFGSSGVSQILSIQEATCYIDKCNTESWAWCHGCKKNYCREHFTDGSIGCMKCDLKEIIRSSTININCLKEKLVRLGSKYREPPMYVWTIIFDPNLVEYDALVESYLSEEEARSELLSWTNCEKAIVDKISENEIRVKLDEDSDYLEYPVLVRQKLE